MDPIKTIGQLLTGGEERDTIHIAILPVVAGANLYPGARIKLSFGSSELAIFARHEYGQSDSIGIVDPFLSHEHPKKGQRFWMFLHPNTITGLRHHWAHPAVDHPKHPKNDSEMWLRQFAERWGFDYRAMLEVAMDPDGEEDYIVAMGQDLHSREELGEDHALFWHHISQLTGKNYDVAHQHKVGWSCSC